MSRPAFKVGDEPTLPAARRQLRSLRCAIYTRKSTEEGLDQAFNSLDAQREACAAYIMSQAGLGWAIAPGHYDDGGYSGGNMDRPGLQRLLADTARGLIDIVVVYKIDRLTRALADFAKIVERLDARGASFVSVTQAFNTTTSMGRLTLNVLLSFAQFEREVGAERVRDKIAASRKKGIWMGGSPPLGYDVKDRKLVINDREAETIRWIFTRYLELRSITQLKSEIEGRAIHTKSYVSRTGRKVGGQRWYVGPLRHLLRNRVYVGDAVHKTNVWPGEHHPILDRHVFDAVQAALDASRVARRESIIHHSPGLLTGLVFDDAGNAMSPQATTKRHSGQRNVYYVSQAILQKRDNRGSLPRVAAPRLEGLVSEVLPLIISALAEATPAGRFKRGRTVTPDPSDEVVSPRDDPSSHDTLRLTIRRHVRRITVAAHDVAFDMNAASASIDTVHLVAILTTALAPSFGDVSVTFSETGLQIVAPVALARPSSAHGIDRNRTTPWTSRSARQDPALIKALVLAHRWRRLIEDGSVKSVEDIGAIADLDRNSVRYLLRLAFLAPDLQRAILDGRQPTTLTVRQILQDGLPVLWTDQRRILSSAGNLPEMA